MVRAVLDWELCTIGDPWVDVASSTLSYYLPFEPLRLEMKEGIPTMPAYVRLYMQSRGLSGAPPHWRFYVALSMLRFASLLEGVRLRALQGQNASPDAVAMGAHTDRVAEVGLSVATGAHPLCSRYPRLHGLQQSLMATHVSSLSPRVRSLHARVRALIAEKVMPLEREMPRTFEHWPAMERVRAEAREQGLWNLWLPHDLDPEKRFGGLSHLEYAFLAEETGRSLLGSEAFNCSAPDTGNMELLLRYGTAAQQRRWLEPLLRGEIKSCFAMTEPAVSSSDPSNLEARIERQGDHYVVSGRKWWTSGAMDPRCEVMLFLGRSNDAAAAGRQHTILLIPMRTPGLQVKRPLTVFGFNDAPHGHAEIHFDAVRVPLDAVLLGEGRGLEAAQARLGPGRLHHCMRMVGLAERAIGLFKQRVKQRVTFGKRLVERDSVLQTLADCRMKIEQARLMVLRAAHAVDCVGSKGAREEISLAKLCAPAAALDVIDAAIQVHGAGGLSGDLPLAQMYTWARALRIADGPDEVHQLVVARMELAKL